MESVSKSSVFSDLERKIGLELYKGEKTAEELADVTGADIRDVLDALKHLIKLKIVVKEGFPPKYRLADHIREAVGERMRPVEGIRIRAIVEAQGADDTVVKKALEKLKRSLEKERGVHIISAQLSRIEEQEGVFSGFIELDLSFEALEPLIKFVFFYGPSAIEVLGPERASFDMGDVQRALLLAARMVHGYTTYITKLMTEKELREFNKKLFRELFR